MAARLANLLVGNHPDEAVIEITGPGPQILSPCDLWLASYGAEHELIVQDPVRACWQPAAMAWTPARLAQLDCLCRRIKDRGRPG
ncbi:MAG: hypothetical protein EBS52_05850 [Betaproteobacteria bacterium]|nr:hypothetical protein [Betaproteobacteria bacterium]